MVSEYFGVFQYVRILGFGIRLKTNSKLQGSQLMHLDHEGYKQLKVFIPCKPITQNSGLLLVVNAQRSLSVQKSINYKMVENSKRVADNKFQTANGRRLRIRVIYCLLMQANVFMQVARRFA